MISNVALDVFIGLVFVYLMYSLLATIVQEVISSFLNLRAVVLVKAIRIMLNDRKSINLKSTTTFGKLMERIGITLQSQWHFITCMLPDNTLAKAFYKHPSIKYLSPNVSRSKPSYIEPTNFSSTLLQILRGKNFDGSVPVMLAVYTTLFPMITASNTQPNAATVEVGVTDPVVATIHPETLDKLRQLYIDSAKDVTAFTDSLENWYNETMDRASGWYKRQTRRILFFIGLTIAIGGNVDTIKIYHILSKDKVAREQMVQLAIRSQPQYQKAVDRKKDSGTISNTNITDSTQNTLSLMNDTILHNAYEQVQSDMNESNHILAMGWHTSDAYKQLESLRSKKKLLNNSLKHHPKDSTSLQTQLRNTNRSIQQLAPIVYDDFSWRSSLLGWLMTALALTLGAPFWFDLLNKFMSLRVAGRRPDTSETDDTNDDPKKAAYKTTKQDQVFSKATHSATDAQPEIVADEDDDSTIAQG